MLERLKKARTAAGFTQFTAAEALGATQSIVSKIERGARRIDPVELQEFAVLYGVAIDELLPSAPSDPA